MRTIGATEVRKTLIPGRPGTAHLVREFGKRLVCVRHRVDPSRGVRFTTAEIVVKAERPLKHPEKTPPNALVYVRIASDESRLLSRLRQARAATYDPDAGMWRMRYDAAIRLGLGRRLRRKRPRSRGTEIP